MSSSLMTDMMVKNPNCNKPELSFKIRFRLMVGVRPVVVIVKFRAMG